MPSYITWQKIAIKIKFIDEGTPVAIIGLNFFLKHPRKKVIKNTIGALHIHWKKITISFQK